MAVKIGLANAINRLQGPLGFSPLSLHPVLWLQDQGRYQDSALTTPAVNDGDPVGGWYDYSGYANHATQATLSARPTLKLGVRNGRSVLLFDGVSNCFNLPSTLFSGLTQASLYLVVKQLRTGIGDGLYDLSTTGAGLSTFYAYSDNQIYEGFGCLAGRYVNAVTPPVSITQFNIWNANAAPNAFSALLNGVLLGSAASGSVAFQTVPKIGVNANPNYGNYDWAELLILPSVLSSANDARMRSYLKSKWATP